MIFGSFQLQYISYNTLVILKCSLISGASTSKNPTVLNCQIEIPVKPDSTLEMSSYLHINSNVTDTFCQHLHIYIICIPFVAKREDDFGVELGGFML